MWKRMVLTSVLCLAMAWPGALAALPAFLEIIDLGPVDGYDSSRGDGVSNTGIVGGWSYSEDYATYWDADGTVHDMERAASSRAQDVAGDWIVGRGPNAGGWIYQISTGVATDIGAVEIQGVNENGYAVGQGRLHSPDGEGGWTSEVIPNTNANSINNALQVGGTTSINGPEEAAIWQDGTLTPLGLLPTGSESKCWALSENGKVTGPATANGGSKHAFIAWVDGEETPQIVDIHGAPAGNANSAGIDIRNDGTVVGYAWGTAVVAFYYDPGDETMHDLNDLIPAEWGWTLSLATAISDGGKYITGRGVIGGNTRGFLLVTDRDEQAPQMMGDADEDSDVDDDDLSLLLANWGSEIAGWGQGEFSGQPPVNDDDLSLLLANWTGPLVAAVPEPATISLVFVVAGALWRVRRRA